ncbi:MAG TPA: oxidoreductase [Nocardioidaceae bacterium]|nr:oxidoreductase [Nocardioidaceae bacterium]
MPAPIADPFARLGSLEGVGSAMAATRDGIDALLRDRGLRQSAPDLTGESLLRGAHASAVLEGAEATLDDVRAGSADPIALAAVRLSAELLALVPVLGSSPLQALARLHTLAGKGIADDKDLGRPRDADSARRLGDLGRRLVVDTSAPALVVAAVVHAEIATAAPFVSHNGLVARAAERLVLVARGVDPKALVVPEAGHLALRREYESNLRGYRDGGGAGVHAWLLYAAEAYAAGAEASPLNS